MIGTGNTADGTGAFTVTIPAGDDANETLTAVAKTLAVQKVRQQRSKHQRMKQP